MDIVKAYETLSELQASRKSYFTSDGTDKDYRDQYTAFQVFFDTFEKLYDDNNILKKLIAQKQFVIDIGDKLHEKRWFYGQQNFRSIIRRMPLLPPDF